MQDSQTHPEVPVLPQWKAPRLTTLDLDVTRNGPAPNIEETALTNGSLAPS